MIENLSLMWKKEEEEILCEAGDSSIYPADENNEFVPAKLHVFLFKMSLELLWSCESTIV